MKKFSYIIGLLLIAAVALLPQPGYSEVAVVIGGTAVTAVSTTNINPATASYSWGSVRTNMVVDGTNAPTVVPNLYPLGSRVGCAIYNAQSLSGVGVVFGSSYPTGLASIVLSHAYVPPLSTRVFSFPGGYNGPIRLRSQNATLSAACTYSEWADSDAQPGIQPQRWAGPATNVTVIATNSAASPIVLNGYTGIGARLGVHLFNGCSNTVGVKLNSAYATNSTADVTLLVSNSITLYFGDGYNGVISARSITGTNNGILTVTPFGR